MKPKLSPHRLSRAQIRQQAEAFLIKYNPANKTPIPIEEIAELQLGIKMTAVKGLKKEFDIDGFINSSCDEITIDEGVFLSF